ncbi:hypothetical protein PL10110_360084 [Planktothrix agardhii]|nr:hypothetical protein PL10110_360084 [Planktothrix agardhii]
MCSHDFNRWISGFFDFDIRPVNLPPAFPQFVVLHLCRNDFTKLNSVEPDGFCGYGRECNKHNEYNEY